MLRLRETVLGMVVVLLFGSGVAWGTLLGVNLIENGDAEAGDLSGWVVTGPADVLGTGVDPNTSTGTAGVPVGDSIGAFSFEGGQGGGASSTMSQSVDVSGLSAAIDAGLITSDFEVLVQSRILGSVVDTVAGELVFKNGVGGTLGTFAFSDPSAPSGVFDWDLVEDDRVVPVGTREIELSVVYTRSGGSSTDSYMDNARLVLTPEPAGAVLMGLGVMGVLRRRGRG